MLKADGTSVLKLFLFFCRALPPGVGEARRDTIPSTTVLCNCKTGIDLECQGNPVAVHWNLSEVAPGEDPEGPCMGSLDDDSLCYFPIQFWGPGRRRENSEFGLSTKSWIHRTFLYIWSYPVSIASDFKTRERLNSCRQGYRMRITIQSGDHAEENMHAFTHLHIFTRRHARTRRISILFVIGHRLRFLSPEKEVKTCVNSCY